MRRRDVLRRAGAAATMVGLAGVGAGAGDTTGTAAYAPLGRVAVDGAAEAVVGDDGTTAYLAASSGFATVDVSDPAAPTVLAERRDILADREEGPLSDILDVSVGGDRLVVAGPANRTRSPTLEGFALYDVSDPADPTRVAFYESGHPIHNAFVDGDTVYITDGTRLQVVDVADDAPEHLASWTVTDHDAAYDDVYPALRNIHDVFVQDGRAFLPHWDAGTFVLDVSDPAAPTYAGDFGGRPLADLAAVGYEERAANQIEPPGNDHYVQVSDDGTVAAVGKESWDVAGTADGGPSGIELWDVSDLAAPTLLSTIPPEPTSDETYRSGTWTTSHNFELDGDRLYTSWYQGGVKLFDVADPASPERLAWWLDPAEMAFWTARTAAGDQFVASTHAVPPQTDPFEGLVTFPDRAGEQADRPVISPTPTPSPTPEPTPTPDPTPTPSPTPSPTPEPTPTETPSPTPTAAPGLGVLAAVAALAGAAARRLRGRR